MKHMIRENYHSFFRRFLLGRILSCLFMFLLSAFFSIFSYGQEAGIVDSLKGRLRVEKSANERVDILSNLAYEYAIIDEVLALEYGNKAVLEAEKSLSNKNKAQALSALAYVYDVNAKGILAVKYYINALEIAEKEGDKKQLSSLYHNLGSLYLDREEYVTSLKYLQKSFEIDSLLNDSVSLCYTLNAMLATNRRLKNYDIAQQQFNLAQRYIKGVNDNLIKASIYTNYANLCLSMGNEDEAHEYLILSHPIYINESPSFLPSFYSVVSSYWQRKGLNDSALYYARMAYFISDSNHYMKQKMMILSELSHIFELTNKPDSALFYYKMYSEISDSLTNQKKSLQLNELEAIYENKKSEELIFKQQLEIEKSRLRYIIGLSSFLLLLIVAILLFVRYRTNKKNNKILAEKNRVIEEALVQKDFLLREVHHRVKNNLQLISSILSLHAQKDKSESGFYKDVTQRIKAISLIHQKLYQQNELDAINVKIYMEDLVNSIRYIYRDSVDDSEVNFDIEPSLALHIDDIISLGLIMNELVTNSFKYGRSSNGVLYLSISFHLHEGKVHVMVSDKGEGVSAEKEGTGFGMRMVEALVEKLSGTCSYNFSNGFQCIILFAYHGK